MLDLSGVKRNRNIIDLTGQVFGRLTVIGLAPKQPGELRTKWMVECSCGKRIQTDAHNLKYRTKSCGCSYSDRSTPARNGLYITYKFDASRRGIQFALSEDLFKRLTSDDCYYCAASPAQIFRKATSSVTFNGIDRVDNSIGYISTNVVSCCKRCNYIKNNASFEEIVNIYNGMVRHRNLNGRLA